MTDEERAMAYADGELDPVAAKRFERLLAQSPDLAEAVRKHRALRTRLESGFAPIAAEPLPAGMTASLRSNVVALRPKPRITRYRAAAASMAACLVAALAIGYFWQAPSAGLSGGRLASATLARALDQQLAGGQGPTRVLVSFRDAKGSYCRVFEAPESDGIACREERGWAVRQSQPKAPGGSGEYRQAGSSALFAAAQGMMAGDPLEPGAGVHRRLRQRCEGAVGRAVD